MLTLGKQLEIGHLRKFKLGHRGLATMVVRPILGGTAPPRTVGKPVMQKQPGLLDSRTLEIRRGTNWLESF